MRLDPEQDKDIIEFIDSYGSTRAGFIKQVLRIYRKQIESGEKSEKQKEEIEPSINEQKKIKETPKAKPAIKEIAFNSKDFD